MNFQSCGKGVNYGPERSSCRGKGKMPSGPQTFKRSDAQRLIRSAREAGLRITRVVLERDRVILQVGDALLENGGERDEVEEWLKKQHAHQS
jgi:hypothetical protein